MGKKHVDALIARAEKIMVKAMKDLEEAKQRAADLRLEAEMLDKKAGSIKAADKAELEAKADQYALKDAPEAEPEPAKGV